MNRLEGVTATLEFLMTSKRKRHIVGGILLSTSLLFAGLAFTVITLRPEEQENGNETGYIE